MVPILIKDFGLDHVINAGGEFTDIRGEQSEEGKPFVRSLMRWSKKSLSKKKHQLVKTYKQHLIFGEG